MTRFFLFCVLKNTKSKSRPGIHMVDRANLAKSKTSFILDFGIQVPKIVDDPKFFFVLDAFFKNEVFSVWAVITKPQESFQILFYFKLNILIILGNSLFEHICIIINFEFVIMKLKNNLTCDKKLFF